MVRKGRIATGINSGSYTKPERRRRGEENGCSKLTADQVREIRILCDAKKSTYSALARKYNVSKKAVALAARRLTWQHI
jgi:hypothetical protein